MKVFSCVVAAIFLMGCGGGGKGTPTAQCGDGTVESGPSCAGLCSTHDGVVDWISGCRWTD